MGGAKGKYYDYFVSEVFISVNVSLGVMGQSKSPITILKKKGSFGCPHI
jgi:hypothetical protein